VLRLDSGLAQHGVAHAFRALAEAATHVVLAAERLHHLDPDDGFVRRLGDVALALLHLAGERRHAPGEAQCEHRDRRHRHRRVEREPGVDDHEDDSGAHDHHQALHPLDEPPADEVADGVEVVRRPRQHLAGGVPVEERAGIPQVGVVQKLAHAGLDADADARRRVAPREVDPEPHCREAHDRDDVRPQPLRVIDDRVVDRALREQRNRDRHERVGQGEREPESAETPLLPPEPEQPAERREQAEVGRIDVIQVLGHGEWARPSALLRRVGDGSTLAARAAVRERREAFAEARRCERRLERPARFGGLAPV